MESLPHKSFDYIIVGGGLAGVVLASRISKSKSCPSVLLLEAGPDCAGHPLTSEPLACFGAHYSDIDYAYATVPQDHLNNRVMYNAGGKILGGGTATNYGTWTRGPKVDYDNWAETVGDENWSYESLLPYFKKVEGCVRDGQFSAEQHGFDGPVKLASVSETEREYPLDKTVLGAWKELGVKTVVDGNGGSPLGLAEMVESFGVEGRRQPASLVYDLSQATVLTNTTVVRVIMSKSGESMIATGVQLLNGEIVTATREVVLTSGAYRTPQLLLLSGIGDIGELTKHGIKQLVDSPEVGRNFWDHAAVCLWWKLREPEKGLAMGSAHPRWAGKAYEKGLPAKYFVFDSVPSEELLPTLVADGFDTTDAQNHDILKKDRIHLETFICYAPAQSQLAEVPIPFDGTHITTLSLNMAPLSRGRISLGSADPTEKPLIDPNYCEEETDMAVFRHGIRRMLKLVQDTQNGQEMVLAETPPPGYPALNTTSTDVEIDARVRRVAVSFFHAAGSASMGKVVDTKLKVKGVNGLRVCDASVLPVGIAGKCLNFSVQCPLFLHKIESDGKYVSGADLTAPPSFIAKHSYWWKFVLINPPLVHHSYTKLILKNYSSSPGLYLRNGGEGGGYDIGVSLTLFGSLKVYAEYCG